ncbi:YdcF family protein [Alteribacillus bidgolensis]|uniref:DUF218 domain-containing protein n=1 Tax=Alteribacillus bidgolensis TaxID=930129 RepID=A0A1G8PN05_9BACI|nr:YdcF family protein [Alteribacillus bidgolensis]SDI93853.1 DUF218 domain-containing protein [Alteribacillus bidgolensis]
MKRTWVVLAANLFVLVVFFFPRSIIVDHLFYEDTPKPSDVIIVLSGNSDRMEKGAELYRDGYAETVLLTNGASSNINEHIATEHGIDRADILIEERADSTYENALFSRDIVTEEGFDSAIVVTSNYIICAAASLPLIGSFLMKWILPMFLITIPLSLLTAGTNTSGFFSENPSNYWEHFFYIARKAKSLFDYVKVYEGMGIDDYIWHVIYVCFGSMFISKVV